MHPHGDITDVPGIRVGHAQDPEALTGCTAILFPPDGAVAGMEQIGGAPGTRETDLLRTRHLVQKIHGLVFAGGSAFGLDAASGVVTYLESQGVGFPTGAARVPIVPSAVIYDLGIGDASIRPDAQMGRWAAERARGAEAGPLQQGNVGAGTGASVGKVLGKEWAMKGGEGSSSARLPNDVFVGALAVVNAFGDIIDRSTGEIVAGARNPSGDPPFVDTLSILRERTGMGELQFGRQGQKETPGTVLGLVAVNAQLTKEEANIIARMAVAGLARVIRPAFTLLDGDTVFAVSMGGARADTSTLGAVAAEVLADAVMQGVRQAKWAGDLPSCTDISRGGS
ncbi:MAG: P1 family peptidase [Candidatus Eisenbacteria bacterium]|uniref:P1 family peptidase n=1 Tax=Eiseniibacteriota bacterium TaxID=2212470 RepID=A0A948W6P9_UNCEI|nr:P1 family peptidase [Candidatus Eisenbacteria bacterium]MBU2691749.1 P1 family peptidase [Candidatus Eisenbacteria bacterium]